MTPVIRSNTTVRKLDAERAELMERAIELIAGQDLATVRWVTLSRQLGLPRHYLQRRLRPGYQEHTKTRGQRSAARARQKELTYKRLFDLLAYDLETGEFTWRVNHNYVKAGSTAGWLTPDGRFDISIDGKKHRASRLAWFYVLGVWPACEVDHKNGNPADNRWDNLREATHTQNAANTKLRKDNKCGVKGVYWDRERKRWKATIVINRRQVPLGRFNSIDEAKNAYAQAAHKAFGEFARLA